METHRSFSQSARSVWSALLAALIVLTQLAGSLPVRATASEPADVPARTPVQSASSTNPAVPQDTPVPMVDDYFSRYSLGGGFLY